MTKEKILRKVNRRKHKWPLSAFACGFAFIVVLQTSAFYAGRKYERTHTAAPVTVKYHVEDPKTGEWVPLSPEVSSIYLFCGTPEGGFACEVNNRQPGIEDGEGILMVPSHPVPPQEQPSPKKEDNSHRGIIQGYNGENACISDEAPLHFVPCTQTRKGDFCMSFTGDPKHPYAPAPCAETERL